MNLKSNWLLAGATLLHSLNASAVTVTKCPKDFDIEIKNIKTFSADFVKGTVAVDDQEEAESQRQVAANLNNLERTFTLDQKASTGGVCWYERANGEVVKFYSDQQGDRLRIYFVVGKNTVLSTFLKVQSYSENGFSLSSGSALLNATELGGDMPVSDFAPLAKGEVTVK